MNITITDKAVKEIDHILKEQGFQPEEKVYLRLKISGGGCSGFQTKLDLDAEVNEKMDETFQFNTVNVVVDKRSAMYIDGATVDFHDDINKRGFSIDIAGNKGKCGCSQSFSM